MSNLSRTTKKRRVDEELNCIMSNLQSNHTEIPEQTTVTLSQISANNANIADIPLPTKPCPLIEGTFIK